MDIIRATPTVTQARCARRDWTRFIHAIRTSGPGEWFCVPVDQVTGTTSAKKQNAAHCVANRIGFRIQTRIEGANLFFRVVGKKNP